MLTYSLFMENEGIPDLERWENIYDPTAFYVGNTDDLNVYHYKDLILKVYGADFDLKTLNDPAKLDALYKEAEKLPEPKIKAKYITVNTPVGKQFRFMGQRYIFPIPKSSRNWLPPCSSPFLQGCVDKSLSTALGSWAQLRHDTILYGKQSGAECGGGEEPPQVKGYVEPNIPVYEKLLWLTRYSRANLRERSIITGSLKSKMQHFEDLLQFLINCSVK